MDRGDIQEAKSIEMDDGLDAMSEMDGVKDGSQFVSRDLGANCVYHLAEPGNHAKGPGMERKDHNSGLRHVKLEVPLKYPSAMSIM